MVLCDQVVKQYPRSAVAPKAYYTAALCARHLGALNEWWRREEKQKHLRAKGIELMEALAKKFPNHELAPAARKYARVFREEDKDEMGRLFTRP